MTRALLACVCLSGCSLTFETPTSAVIDCTGGQPCPAEWTCHATLELCVPPTGDDKKPPTATLTFADDVIRAGDTVTLLIAASEPLDAEPRLVDTRPWTLVASAPRTARYTYERVIAPDEPEGPHTTSATIVDLSGNSATPPAVTLTIDNTAPQIVAFAWAFGAGKSALKPGEVAAVSATVEAEAETLELALFDGAGTKVTDLDPVVSPISGDAAHLSVSATVVAPLNPGDFYARLVVTDAAGNSSTKDTAHVSVDGEPPTLTTIAFLSPTTTGIEAPLLLAAQGATAFKLAGDVAPSDWKESAFPVTTTVTLTLGDGEKTVSAVFRDAAGNESAPVSATVTLALAFDQMPPTLTSASAPSETRVVLSFSEPVSASEAEDVANYSVPGLTISQAVLESNRQAVTLFTSQQAGGVSYTITVSGVHDLSGNSIVPPNDAQSFLGFGPQAEAMPPAILAPFVAARQFSGDVDFAWSSRAGASSYTFELALDDPTTATAAEDYAQHPIALVTQPGTTYHRAGLAPGSYHWRVRANVTTQGAYGDGSVDVIGDRLYVYCASTQTCSDASGNGSKVRPLQSLSRAIADAQAFGLSRVEVAARNPSGSSSYNELVVISRGVDVFGGWDPLFTSRAPAINVTRIKGTGNFTMIALGIDTPTVIDGLVVQGGAGDSITTLLIAGSDQSLSLRNCTFLAADDLDDVVVVSVSGSGTTPSTGPELVGCTIGQPASVIRPTQVVGLQVAASGLRLTGGTRIDIPRTQATFAQRGIEGVNGALDIQGGSISVGGPLGGVNPTGVFFSSGTLVMDGVTVRVNANTGSNQQATGISSVGSVATLRRLDVRMGGAPAARSIGVSLGSGVLASSMIVAGDTSGSDVSACGYCRAGSIGVLAYGYASTITNNTIVSGNGASALSDSTVAIEVAQGAAATITNNLLVTGVAQVAECVREIDATPYSQTVALHHNALVGCPTLFRDNDQDGAGADTAALLTLIADVNDATKSTGGPASAAACNTAWASAGAAGISGFPGDLRLNGAPFEVASGGADTRAMVCGPLRNQDCGLGADWSDLAGVARTCPTAPSGPPGCAQVGTSCVSIGGYEDDP